MIIPDWFKKDGLSGKRGFCLGNGPSINSLRNIHLLDDEITIGCNYIFKIFTPTILCWVDEILFIENKETIENLRCLKVTRQKYKKYPPDIIQAKVREHATRLCLDEKFQMYGTTSTGALCFQIAYWLGCEPIILLGFDGTQTYRDDITSFYGKNKRWTNNSYTHNVQTLLFIRRADELLFKRNKIKARRTIINCSNNIFFPTRTDINSLIDYSK